MNLQHPDHRASRRHAINLLGTGLAAAPVLLASGGARTQATPPPRPAPEAAPAAQRRTMRDPRNEYPKPPFPNQQEIEWPGLTSGMDPRPDHGEDSYVGSGRLQGRKALITGGDSGLGRATAIAYAREGADVAINYLQAEQSDADEVVELIRAAGRTAVAIPGDIREENFCRDLVARTVDELGGLDILVNNAARQTAQPSISDISTDQFDATMKTNLYAMFWITKAALEHLPPGATIINTASVVAANPPALLLDYSATKAGIIAFTQSLAKQLVEQGIRVNAVAPGPYWTPLQPSGGQPIEDVETFGSNAPLGRPGQPAEIAPIFVLLASQESSYATGNAYSSTGGNPGP